MADAAPTEDQILAQTKWLEMLPGEAAMRKRTATFHQLAMMELPVDLPTHVTRGETRELPLADMLDMSYSIMSERHGYQTSVVLTAIDDTPQTTVDRIEKWIAARVGQFLRRWLLTDEAGWHQLLSYAGLILWCQNGPQEPVHSRIETPDIFSVCFPVKGKGRAAVFSRRYRMLLRDALDHFPASEADLYAAALSDDRSAVTTGTLTSFSGSSAGFAKEVEIIHHDNGVYVSYLAVSSTSAKDGKQAGKIIWQDKSYAGPDEEGNTCSSLLVVPGFITPHREPKHRLMPMFIPGLQAMNALLFLTAVMASKAENTTGDVLVEQDAEVLKAAAVLGKTDAFAAQLDEGNPSIVPVSGKPLVWERLPEPYLQALLEFWSNRYDRWSNSLREIADPTLLAQINTNVYLPHSAARRKLMAPMLDNTDEALKELVRMDMHALQFYGPKKSVKLVSRGGERYGKAGREMAVAQAVEITADDIRDFDKRFVLSISTSSMSEEEQRQRLMAHEEKVMMGYATKRQGIPVAGYSDEEGQLLELATDEVYRANTALLQPQLPQTIADAVRTVGGMAIAVQGPPVAPPQATPTGAGGGVQYQTPVVPGATGQSEPVVQ